MSSPNQPIQPIQLQTEGAAPAAKPSIVIQFTDAKALDGVKDSGLNHLQLRLGEFSQQILQEARSIERTEHVGKGPTEIIAAHIDEAWWVSRRRIRRSKHPIGGTVVRIVQAFGIAGLGIGVSNLKQTWWGPLLFVVSTIATCIAFLVESYLQRAE